jgi:hypothetical protein
MRCPQRPFKCKLNQCGLFLCHKKFAKSRDEYFAGLFVDLELSEQSPWSITSGGGHGFGGGDFHGGGWRGSYGGGGYGLAGFGLAYYGGCYGYGCGYPYGYRYPDGYYGLLDPSATRDDTVRLANTQRGSLRLIAAESVDGPPAFRPAGLAYQSRRIFLTHHAIGNRMFAARLSFVMKPTPIISEKKSAITIWIGAAVFTIGAMFFGH